MIPPAASAIAANVAAVRGEVIAACRRVGRDPAGVRLIAVTKSQGSEALGALFAAGVADYGENRIDHLAEMHAHQPPGGVFHAIGRVQGRQLAKLVPLSGCLHSLCDPDHIPRLGRACAELGRRLPVFLQVNTADDADKAGMTPADLPLRLDLARAQTGLEVVGLMTMAPLTSGPEGAAVARRCFATLRVLAERHRLPRLSMGMSQDFVIAVEEGATDIRVGTRLFA